MHIHTYIHTYIYIYIYLNVNMKKKKTISRGFIYQYLNNKLRLTFCFF